MAVWKRPQLTLPKVVRWSKYRKRGTRRQDTLQHTLSIMVLADCVLSDINQYVAFNKEFVSLALRYHDFGEGETAQGDTLYIDKTVAGDIAEVDAFAARFGIVLGEEVMEAFLLQFAKNAEKMGKYRQQLRRIKKEHKIECLVFDALERFDYFLYAYEQYVEHKKGTIGTKILVQVLRHNVPHFKRLARELRGFKEVLWTPELAQWCEMFLERYKGLWIEKKGEK
ncbi:MAG TPA: hypothetical protein VG753_01125 [Candidatus Paceibacterota bacterium]|nr:hypothetical protein [Candidatus Paceibacterota bacterium]